MKNFPHQINRLDRLARGLQVFSELIAAGADLADDGVVGDALARVGVYTFREAYDPANVEELLAEEHSKPASSQGTRTMARELRRTFLHLDLVSQDEHGFELSPEATRLTELEHDPLSSEAKALWQSAFRRLALADDSGTSHPYEIMLRLVGERPGIESGLLGLALEAHDDSDSEFQRILGLADAHGTNSAWEEIGVSQFQRANSVKILPAVARQLGDIEAIGGRAYRGLPDPTAPTLEEHRRTRTAVRSRRRRYDSQRTRGRRPTSTGPTVRSYDPDLSASRYGAHEECLSAFNGLFDAELPRWEGDYDLLVVSGSEALLVEVKTIRLDAPHQVRLAVGQLLYYEHFDVRPDWPDTTIHRLVVVDAELDSELLEFLAQHDIGAVWKASDGQWSGDERARQQLGRLGVALGDGS